jgi:hypothetical protein
VISDHFLEQEKRQIILNTRRRAKVKFSVPEGLYDITGHPAPGKISLMSHEGRLYLRKT